MALGVDVWASIEARYIAPPTLSTYPDERRAYNDNAKNKNEIVVILNQSKLVKVTYLKSSKEVWDKLRKCYEGYEKVKQVTQRPDEEITH